MSNISKPKLQQLFDAMDSGEKLFPLFKEVFNDFRFSELSAIDELSIGVAWVRKGSALGKFISYKDIDGLDEKKMKIIVNDLKSAVESLGDLWNFPERLIVIPNENKRGGAIVYNWDKAHNVKNHNIWKRAKEIRSSEDFSEFLKQPPKSDENESEREFSVRIRTAITNPENGEVWGVGSDVTSLINDCLDKGMSWDEALESCRKEIEDENEISSLFPYLRPNVSLLWDVISPDNQLISGNTMLHLQSFNRRGLRWYKTNDAKRWTQEAHHEIANAMAIFAGRYILDNAFDFTNSKFSSVDYLDRHIYASEVSEESIGKILGLGENEDFPSFYKRMQDQYPVMAKNLSHVLTDTLVYANLLYSRYDVDSVNNAIKSFGYPSVQQKNYGNEDELKNYNNLFKNIEATRNWVSSLEWLSDDNLNDYIQAEKNFVSHLYKYINIDSISDEDKNDFYQVALWNGITDVFEKVDLNTNPSVDIKDRADVVSKDEIKNIDIISKDWSSLIDAFDIDYEANNDLNHPFINWIERLNLPQSITRSTTEWFVHSNQFNEINRVLLRKKDSDESHLHEQLADKLKNVLEVTNQIMEENKKSGGWWGRVRKGFSGADPEEWADAFLDFQEHIHKMFVSIDEQIKKDEVWLENARGLVQKSTDVDNLWSSWLKREANAISTLHDGANNPSTAKKMSWDKRVEVLTSSKNAHQNIINSVISTKMWLEKVNQSVETKRQLKERAEMFYWSTLSMFSSLQSIQRNTNTIMEQADLVKTMSKSAEGASLRALYEEEENREKIKQAFVKMSQSESSVKEFYTKLASFQKETSVIMKKSLETRQDIPDVNEVEIASSSMNLSSDKLKETKQKQMQASISLESSSGPIVTKRKIAR